MTLHNPTRSVRFVWNKCLNEFVSAVGWSPDGSRIVVASSAGEMVLLNGDSGAVIFAWEHAHSDAVNSVAWNPDNITVVTTGQDGAIRWWNILSGEKIAEKMPGPLWVETAMWSAQPVADLGHLLAVGAGHQVTLWNIAGEMVVEPQSYPRAVADLGWTLGTTLAVATSTSISFHHPQTGARERIFLAKDPILKMSISPSGKWLMTGTQDCAIHIWNCDSESEMHMRGYPAKVREMAWHKSSRWLATGAGEGIAVWDCSGRGPEGRMPNILEWHYDRITALQYQSCGDWLASGAKDGGIAVWSPTQQRQQLVASARIPSGVTQVIWAPAGQTRRLLVTGQMGEVQMLEIG